MCVCYLTFCIDIKSETILTQATLITILYKTDSAIIAELDFMIKLNCRSSSQDIRSTLSRASASGGSSASSRMGKTLRNCTFALCLYVVRHTIPRQLYRNENPCNAVSQARVKCVQFWSWSSESCSEECGSVGLVSAGHLRPPTPSGLCVARDAKRLTVGTARRRASTRHGFTSSTNGKREASQEVLVCLQQPPPQARCS